MAANAGQQAALADDVTDNSEGLFCHQDFFENHIVVKHVGQVVHARAHGALEVFAGRGINIDALTGVLFDAIQQRLFGTIDLILGQHAPYGRVPLSVELD